MKIWRVASLENSLSLQIWHFLVRYHSSRHIMTQCYCRSVFIAVPGHIQLPHQPVGSEQGARRSLRSDQRESCHSLQFLVSFYLGESQSLSQLSSHFLRPLQAVSSVLAFRRYQQGSEADMRSGLLGGPVTGETVGDSYQSIGGYNSGESKPGQGYQQI